MTHITKKEIAEGYDAVADKILMDPGFYDHCLAMYRGYRGSVLDIGCGQGLLLKKVRLLASPGSFFTGIDISGKLCAMARINNPDAIIVQGDAESLPFKDSSFDIILMTEVVEHLLDYAKALYEVRRVLKRGGVFIVSVPNRDWASYDFYDKIRNHTWQPVDDHYFRFEEITGLLARNGFRIEKYRGLDNLFYYGWKHKFEDIAAFFLPLLHRKMKRLVFKCVNEKE